MQKMMRFFCLGVFLVVQCLATVSFAENEFKNNNPDGNKYEFTRSYISALSNLVHIDERWTKKDPKKLFPGNDDRVIKASINYLATDNADLRIVKNYLAKYLISPNTFIRKVADIVVVACDNEIALNNQEKILWEKWGDLRAAGQGTRDKEKEFIKRQMEFSFKRKEIDKEIIQASIFMTKVLISAEKNKDTKGRVLAITTKEREKLIAKLDTFGSETTDWGLKPGQKTLQASVAVIREVLEDPLWIAIDENKQ